MTIEFTVDRDGYTNGIQLHIGNQNHGYRLAGPKYLGGSETLLAVQVNADTARQIVELVQAATEPVIILAEERHGRIRLSVGPESAPFMLAGSGSSGEFRKLKRAVLDERDVQQMLRYLTEAAAQNAA